MFLAAIRNMYAKMHQNAADLGQMGPSLHPGNAEPEVVKAQRADEMYGSDPLSAQVSDLLEHGT